MVDSIKAAIDLLAAAHGNVTLALLCRIGEENLKWTLIFASRWSDQEPIQTSTRIIIESLSAVLNPYELTFISNVKVLSTSDPFVKKFNTLYSPVNAGESMKNLSINEDTYSDVIVIKSSSELSNASRVPQSRDPKLNRTINPIFNRSINPIFNRTINPIFNRSINPIFNRTINPIFNSTINPRVSLNPDVSLAYDNNLRTSYYMVDATDKVSLLYDLNNEWLFYAVRATENIRLIYDRTNQWKFYLVKANEEVEILYGSNNEHTGFVVSST